MLGDIPGLGWLFKNRSYNKTRNSLIVFITPQVVRSPEDVENNVRRVLEERRRQMRAEYDTIFGKTGQN